MKSLSVVMIFLASFAAPVSADYDAGMSAYKQGNYATALAELRPLAENGSALAQVALGVMYTNGQGVPQDFKEALRWYRLAANEENGGAQFNIGVMYANGKGVPQDFKEALRWYRLAAQQGETRAQ